MRHTFANTLNNLNVYQKTFCRISLEIPYKQDMMYNSQVTMVFV